MFNKKISSSMISLFIVFSLLIAPMSYADETVSKEVNVHFKVVEADNSSPGDGGSDDGNGNDDNGGENGENGDDNGGNAGGNGGNSGSGGGSIDIPPVAGPPIKHFNDTTEHWASEIIEELYNLGLIKGINEQEFAPDRMITRAEVTSLILRLLELKPVDAESIFGDVKADAWYYQDINAAVNVGLVNGFNDLFRPEQSITREEMAVILIQALHIKEKGTSLSAEQARDMLNKFNDGNSISDWAKESVAEAVELGIIVGRNNGNFAPHDEATRAEAAAILLKMYYIINN